MPIQTRWRNSCIAPESKRQSRYRSQTTTFPNFASSYPPASHRHFGILTCSLSNECQLLIHFIMVNRSISLLVKVQALTLTELAGFTNVAASEALNHLISAKQISRLRNLAKERGFDRRIDPELYDYYLEDRPRTGRPLKYTEEQDNAFTKLAIENAVSRELKAQDIDDIAKETLNLDISASIVNRILYRRFYKRRKSQWRPDLKAVFRFRRYHWCLQFKNWTLEDWKNVIWTDEIGVIVGVRPLPGT